MRKALTAQPSGHSQQQCEEGSKKVESGRETGGYRGCPLGWVVSEYVCVCVCVAVVRQRIGWERAEKGERNLTDRQIKRKKERSKRKKDRRISFVSSAVAKYLCSSSSDCVSKYLCISIFLSLYLTIFLSVCSRQWLHLYLFVIRAAILSMRRYSLLCFTFLFRGNFPLATEAFPSAGVLYKLR